MVSTEQPPSIGLDPDWLSGVLTRNGVAPDQVVFDGFVGTGQMSRNARFSVTWPAGVDAPSDSLPSSVIVKVPSSDPDTRALSFEHSVYQIECGFYEKIASLVDIEVPSPLGVHMDADGADFAIVLEDLRGSEQGDHFAGPSDEQMALAIGQAAALHASAWGSTDRAEFDVLHKDRTTAAQSTGDGVALFLPLVLERLGDGLDPDVVEMLQQFQSAAGEWHRQQHRPTTLVHGDFRLDNFMFAVEPGARPMVVVDWQTAHAGLGTTDLAYLIGGSLEPEHRRGVEPELIESYLQQLRDRGVSYTDEQCRSDYAVSALHGVYTGIVATIVADRTERGDALFTLMLNRHGRHALDVDSLAAVADNSPST